MRKKSDTSSKAKEQNSKTTSIYYVWQEHQLWFQLANESQRRECSGEENERMWLWTICSEHLCVCSCLCRRACDVVMYCKYRLNVGRNKNNNEDSKEMDNGKKRTNNDWGREKKANTELTIMCRNECSTNHSERLLCTHSLAHSSVSRWENRFSREAQRSKPKLNQIDEWMTGRLNGNGIKSNIMYWALPLLMLLIFSHESKWQATKNHGTSTAISSSN